MIGRQRSYFCRASSTSCVDEVDDALDQRVREPLFDGAAAPGQRRRLAAAGLLLDRFGELDQPLGGVGPAIEQHVLDELQQLRRDLLVHRELAGVDDAHVEAGAGSRGTGTPRASPRGPRRCRGTRTKRCSRRRRSSRPGSAALIRRDRLR